ncbi:MAG: transcriptional regulator [Alphaproteobacteria bacterium]|nr:MAG: transcriptional regulator [Alphaproteobacteria bacterium]
MRAEDESVVRGLNLFADMAPANFAELMHGAYFQRFPPHVQLIAEGDPADFLYVVVDGGVELFARANNREATMAILRPVSTFILAAVLREAVYLMSARTMEASRLLMIPSENIHIMLARDADFARAIVRELATCYRSVIKALKDQKLRTAVERLANYILREHEKQGGDGELHLRSDKRTLAALLGMTPENLSRAFNTLRPYGVAVDGRSVRVSKLPDLITLAKPTPLIDDPRS